MRAMFKKRNLLNLLSRLVLGLSVFIFVGAVALTARRFLDFEPVQPHIIAELLSNVSFVNLTPDFALSLLLMILCAEVIAAGVVIFVVLWGVRPLDSLLCRFFNQKAPNFRLFIELLMTIGFSVLLVLALMNFTPRAVVCIAKLGGYGINDCIWGLLFFGWLFTLLLLPGVAKTSENLDMKTKVCRWVERAMGAFVIAAGVMAGMLVMIVMPAIMLAGA